MCWSWVRTGVFGGGERQRPLRKVRDLMERSAKGELSRSELAEARGEIEAVVRRFERLSGTGGQGFSVELSPYMKSLLKLAREPEAPASATARRAAGF